MKYFKVFFVLLILAISTSAQAQLVSRLGGLAYYDTESDLTWLADANYAQTSGYDSDGLMNWGVANEWANNLSVEGVTGWHLADTLQPDPGCSIQKTGNASYGFNCTESIMGNMFHNVLGGSSNNSITSVHNANYNLFTNIQSGKYWSSTDLELIALYAWYFDFSNGEQNENGKGFDGYAWAVYTGDVSTVPVPPAIWLFCSGLFALVGFRIINK